MENRFSNRLCNEISPYLLQHAHNPVDWYPWGKEAFDKAKKLNKPILLSIGYAACHWCHVMERESFEDVETAQLMNNLFVNIKVDKEERPDLDKIYQTAHFLLTQRGGGWPLTLFLTPDDLVPFFAGTYFPKVRQHNLPAFKEILTTIAEIYQTNANDITHQNAELLRVMKSKPLDTPITAELTNEPVKIAIDALQKNFDQQHGGFGKAPKFPQPSLLSFLLKNQRPLALETLDKMAAGGINDQLGGGFFRYTVDNAWRIPHFEKMLSDNAQLLWLYSLAGHEQIAKTIADWLLNKMQSSEGGFYSSLDADSENMEGKYYSWNKFEVSHLLSPEEYNAIASLYGLTLPPNFEKQWHFYIANPQPASELLDYAKKKLLTAREKRIPPRCDTKILTAWNALVIKALYRVGDTLKEKKYLAAADRALELIFKKMWINKRLLASYKDNKAHLAGYLDDYAFLLDALIASLQVRWRSDYLNYAIEVAESLLRYFEDPSGGFYFTAHDHEKLLHRLKITMDEATPAGNSIAIAALITLGYLVGESRYLNAAEKSIRAAWPLLMKVPVGHCSLLLALEKFLNPPPIVIIRGSDAETCAEWQDYCKQRISNTVFIIPETAKNLPAGLAAYNTRNKTCAYICQGTRCSAVIEDFEELKTVGKND